MTDSPAVSLRDIEAARRRIDDALYTSPCAYSRSLSELTGATIHVKLENLQRTGSFKERGALNRLLTMSDAERAAGVIAASAGNHAQSLAYHATRLGLKAKVVMPLGTPLTKVVATRRYGGEVVLKGSNYDEAFEHALELAAGEGRTLVHAFDDRAVIAGQGTVGLELLEQLPFIDDVVVPIGGGGLISGISMVLKETNPRIRVTGVQTAALPSMQRSLSEGAPVVLPPAVTIADGIAIKRPGKLTFPLVQRYVDRIVTVAEDDIAAAILALLEQEKTLVEGAGAAALAAVTTNRAEFEGRKVCLVLSGGNIDMHFLARIIEQGLVRDGRLTQLMVRIIDRPGMLARLTTLVGELQANILQISQNRAFRHTTLGEVEVELSLETRGSDHVEDLLRGLKAAGYRVVTIPHGG